MSMVGPSRFPARGKGSEGTEENAARQRVLIADGDAAIRSRLERVLLRAGYEVSVVGDGRQALDALSRARFDCVLLDLDVPGLNGLNVLSAIPALDSDALFIAMTASAEVGPAVEAMKLGAWDHLRKPIEDQEVLELVRQAEEEVGLARTLAADQTGESVGFAGMIGRSPAMQRLYRMIERVAPTRATVLIQGETGTGKELVAQAIHATSPRSRKPFIPLNCSALADTLLDSELFGHSKGSFTGAIQTRRGWIEEADGGTLFLDEIATLSENVQIKLLRVLEERVIHRIGSQVPVPVDFRLLVATNRNLEELVRAGRIREDFYYRIAILPLHVPPLRERRDDIPLLVGHFRARFAREVGVSPPSISSATMRRLVSASWPGNVRELENFVERLVVLEEAGEPIPLPCGATGSMGTGHTIIDEALEGSGGPWDLERLEREYILGMLEHFRGRQGRTATALGVSRRTIHRKLKRYREEGWLPDREDVGVS